MDRQAYIYQLITRISGPVLYLFYHARFCYFFSLLLPSSISSISFISSTSSTSSTLKQIYHSHSSITIQ